jgi:hypothetical protein
MFVGNIFPAFEVTWEVMYIVTCLIKAGIVEPEETAVTMERSVGTRTREQIGTQ